MKTTAVAGLVLLLGIAALRPGRATSPPRSRPIVESAQPAPASIIAVEPPPARERVDAEIDQLIECNSVPDLVQRLRSNPSDAIALAAIIALGRSGDPGALPTLLVEVDPARPFRASMALQSIHEIDKGELAGKLADELLRSPLLGDPDPIYQAAAVVKGVRIDDVVAELAEGGSAHAKQWMVQRKESLNMPLCGKEHP